LCGWVFQAPARATVERLVPSAPPLSTYMRQFSYRLKVLGVSISRATLAYVLKGPLAMAVTDAPSVGHYDSDPVYRGVSRRGLRA
jgi:hypothetical protein